MFWCRGEAVSVNRSNCGLLLMMAFLGPKHSLSGGGAKSGGAEHIKGMQTWGRGGGDEGDWPDSIRILLELSEGDEVTA